LIFIFESITEANRGRNPCLSLDETFKMFPTEAGRTDPEYCRDLPQHIFTPNEDDKALEIGIIGAGIAGLAAAAGLCRSGHGVEACVQLE